MTISEHSTPEDYGAKLTSLRLDFRVSPGLLLACDEALRMIGTCGLTSSGSSVSALPGWSSWRTYSDKRCTSRGPISKRLAFRSVVRPSSPPRWVQHIGAGDGFFWLATLTLKGNYNRKGSSLTSGDGLATQIGGRLNPRWLEWYMGFPVGWLASDVPTSEHWATPPIPEW